MTEGTIAAWLVAPGSTVQSGQAVVAIETEKAEYEVEAAADGVLGVPMVNVNETVPVGAVLAYIVSLGEDVGRTVAPSVGDASLPLPPGAPDTGLRRSAAATRRPSVSPRARRLAAERGIDLSTVQGSGPGGLVVEADIERAAAAAPCAEVRKEWDGRRVRERRRLGPIQRTSARRLAEACKVPHIVQMVDADVSRIQQLRRQWKQEARPLAAVSFNDFVVKASALALAESPELNASVEGDELILFSDINAGVAVDTPRGLLVPVVMQADRLSLLAIAAESKRLAEKARTRGLEAGDASAGTFTVSNLGAFGIRAGTPILNAPESVLIFVGAVEDRPIAHEGAVLIRPMVTLSIAYDHRVADGAAAARLTGRIRALLEDPAPYAKT